MNLPIGGYFSLEVNDGWERHHDALRLNAGRYALEYILKARKHIRNFHVLREELEESYRFKWTMGYDRTIGISILC